MGRRYLSQKVKSAGAFLSIMILLPYVITVFVHGADMEVSGKAAAEYIDVETVNERGEKQVLQVPWEEYFMGVLAKEMPETYEPEALKVQAVLVRTQLYQKLDSESGNILGEHYLADQELEKKWGITDYEKNYKKLKTAIEETKNQVLHYNNTYAMVPFHQSSSGLTRSAQEALGSADYPYLAVRDCAADKEADSEIHIYTMTYKEIQEKCKAFLVAVEKSEAEKTFQFKDFEILSSDSAGYVTSLRIGATTCSGEQFREALSLASSSFSLQDSEGKLKITTTGNGHGMGVSQWTANTMAKAGKSYEEILQYFFEGTNLADGGEIFSKLE